MTVWVHLLPGHPVPVSSPPLTTVSAFGDRRGMSGGAPMLPPHHPCPWGSRLPLGLCAGPGSRGALPFSRSVHLFLGSTCLPPRRWKPGQTQLSFLAPPAPGGSRGQGAGCPWGLPGRRVLSQHAHAEHAHTSKRNTQASREWPPFLTSWISRGAGAPAQTPPGPPSPKSGLPGVGRGTGSLPAPRAAAACPAAHKYRHINMAGDTSRQTGRAQ